MVVVHITIVGVIIIKVEVFLTKEEKIDILKEYQKDLQKETQGISERIKELEAV